MHAPASGRGGLWSSSGGAPYRGRRVSLRAPHRGGHGAECPGFWAGDFGRRAVAPLYRGRRASPCPSNGGGHGSEVRDIIGSW